MSSNPEKTLWLAVLAQAIKDILGLRLLLTDTEDLSDEDYDVVDEVAVQERIDEAVAFVIRYPTVARKLRDIKSREEMEQWLETLEKALSQQ